MHYSYYCDVNLISVAMKLCNSKSMITMQNLISCTYINVCNDVMFICFESSNMSILYKWRIVLVKKSHTKIECESSDDYLCYYDCYSNGFQVLNTQVFPGRNNYVRKLEVFSRSIYEGSEINGKLWLTDPDARFQWLRYQFMDIIEKNRRFGESVHDYLSRVVENDSMLNMVRNQIMDVIKQVQPTYTEDEYSGYVSVWGINRIAQDIAQDYSFYSPIAQDST